MSDIDVEYSLCDASFYPLSFDSICDDIITLFNQITSLKYVYIKYLKSEWQSSVESEYGEEFANKYKLRIKYDYILQIIRI